MDPVELEKQYTPSKWNTRFPEGGIVEHHVQVLAEGKYNRVTPYAQP